MKKDYSILNILVIFFGIFAGLNVFLMVLFFVLKLIPLSLLITELFIQILSIFPIIFLMHLYDYNYELHTILTIKNIISEEDFKKIKNDEL